MAKTKHNRNASPQNKDSKKPKLPKAEISSQPSSSLNHDNNLLESSKTSSASSSVEQKAISTIPKTYQSSIVFAPTNQKLKELLIQVANERYEKFTDEMSDMWMLPHLSSLYGNLSFPQQLNMFTNFIVNYVCLDVNGSVLTRKFVKKMDKSNSNSMVFDKEAYLNDYGDRLNAFVTLRFIIAHLQGNLEVEIDMYGYVQRPNRYGKKTVQELQRIAQSITEKEQRAARNIKKRMEEGGSNNYAFGNFENDFDPSHDHVENFFRIFNEKFEDIPTDKIEGPENVRFYHRKIIANALKAANPSAGFNNTLYKCQDLDVWRSVLEIIFRAFVPSFKTEVFHFVDTFFNPTKNGWDGLVNYVDQNTRLFKKVYKPTMLHRDLNKLQYVLSRSVLFSPEAYDCVSHLLAVVDYNAEILPSRNRTAEYSEYFYLQEMVNNGLSFNFPQDRLRGFMLTMKMHKENKFKFLNQYEPSCVKVSNKLKPIQNHLPKCAHCYEIMKKSRKCSKCHTVNYCSSECQAKDFPEHKLSCPSLAALKSFTVEELRTLVKK